MLSLEEIKKLEPAEAIVKLDEYLAENPDSDEALTLRGMRHWSLNHRREAINDYLGALRINPNSNAKMALKYAYSILDFYDKDQWNP